MRRAVMLHAIAALCSHAGGPFDEGRLDGVRLTCLWRGSVFSIESGHGCPDPATVDQPTFDVRERGGGHVELKFAAAPR
ncbi:Rieske (2Fe-2S) protein [Candidatus Aeolococcus gillhamiae]|uniref:Rieske (2Fe-2S) protein n=1 Tax=Candidatus Aeolococcus gillhamiae TaxID=3127015 RepID=UPI003312FA54